jgi:site-specific DNA-methyltransferase (cytosine-N4-specific)
VNAVPQQIPSISSIAFTTNLGASLIGDSRSVLSDFGSMLKGKVQLVFTSPPFPLNRKKKYDNLQGDAYKKWLANYAPLLTSLLAADGAIVIEVGNAWQQGQPVMSTLALESLLAFKEKAKLHLCQEFIWHNPAKLPTPAQWVTIERIRVKDSFTRLWWLSPTPRPKADNRRVLVEYSPSMKRLLKTRKYNAGRRPSEHVIGEESFFTDNGGAIPPNLLSIEQPPTQDASGDEIAESVLIGSNTQGNDPYALYCRQNGLEGHPARMPPKLAEFFISLCTEPGDLVLDPFGGSNTTGDAAERLKRRWLTIEANPGYAMSGIGRFADKAPMPKTKTAAPKKRHDG